MFFFAFGIKNTLFQLKHARSKLKTMFTFKNLVFKDYWCIKPNQLPISISLHEFLTFNNQYT